MDVNYSYFSKCENVRSINMIILDSDKTYNQYDLIT